jgi:hypothetical protein
VDTDEEQQQRRGGNAEQGVTYAMKLEGRDREAFRARASGSA